MYYAVVFEVAGKGKLDTETLLSDFMFLLFAMKIKFNCFMNIRENKETFSLTDTLIMITLIEKFGEVQ